MADVKFKSRAELLASITAIITSGAGDAEAVLRLFEEDIVAWARLHPPTGDVYNQRRGRILAHRDPRQGEKGGHIVVPLVALPLGCGN